MGGSEKHRAPAAQEWPATCSGGGEEQLGHPLDGSTRCTPSIPKEASRRQPTDAPRPMNDGSARTVRLVWMPSVAMSIMSMWCQRMCQHRPSHQERIDAPPRQGSRSRKRPQHGSVPPPGVSFTTTPRPRQGSTPRRRDCRRRHWRPAVRARGGPSRSCPAAAGWWSLRHVATKGVPAERKRLSGSPQATRHTVGGGR